MLVSGRVYTIEPVWWIDEWCLICLARCCVSTCLRWRRYCVSFRTKKSKESCYGDTLPHGTGFLLDSNHWIIPHKRVFCLCRLVLDFQKKFVWKRHILFRLTWRKPGIIHGYLSLPKDVLSLKTNIAPKNGWFPNRNLRTSTGQFSGDMLVSGRVLRNWAAPYLGTS